MNNVHTQQKNPKSGTTEKSPTKQAVLLNKWSEKEEKKKKRCLPQYGNSCSQQYDSKS